jgi:hypothetical protein
MVGYAQAALRCSVLIGAVGGSGGNNRHHHNRHHNRFHHNDNAVHKQYVKTVEERVIKETIPNKGKFANTGGMPLANVAFLSLASVGLGISILRSAIGRDC